VSFGQILIDAESSSANYLIFKGFNILNKNETFADCGVHKRSGT